MAFWDNTTRRQSVTLREARDNVHKRKMAGEEFNCPCCHQKVFLYPRRITGTMVRQLAQLVFMDGPIKSRELVNSHGGDHAKMLLWGLVSQDEDGLWSATHKGYEFLYDRIKVPEIAYVYNGKLVRYSEKICGVRDRTGKKFDYNELMGRPTQ
jgi:hypothetical protein